jgi:hypothetical protein
VRIAFKKMTSKGLQLMVINGDDSESTAICASGMASSLSTLLIPLLKLCECRARWRWERSVWKLWDESW